MTNTRLNTLVNNTLANIDDIAEMTDVPYGDKSWALTGIARASHGATWRFTDDAGNEITPIQPKAGERHVAVSDPSTATSDVLQDVVNERARQDDKWGEQNHDDFRFNAILGEEFGEVCQVVVQDEFGGEHAGTLRTELLHVAAVAVQWIEKLDRMNRT